MITEFPLFSNISFENKKFIDQFNAPFPAYAEWAFGTLLTWWDAFNDLEIAVLNGNLVVKSSYLTMGKLPLFTLVGDKKIDETLDTIFHYQQQHGHETALYSLPQHTVDAIKNTKKYTIEDDSAAAEYVLSTQMHAFLENHTMYAIRRKIAQFGRATEGHIVTSSEIALKDNLDIQHIINPLHTWENIYKNDQERLEGKIIDRALQISSYIDLKGFGLFIDNQLHGFILYKHLPHHSININHIKTSYAYEGIFSYLEHAFAKELYNQGVKYINFEQDLGIEGLRTHKTSLRPVQMLHKYNVRPNQPA